jgi:hypothetical protein
MKARNTPRQGKKHSKEEILELKDSPKSGIDAIMPSCESYLFRLKWQEKRCTNGGIVTKLRAAAVIFTMDVWSLFLVLKTLFGMVSKHCGMALMSVLTCTSRLKQHPVRSPDCANR